MLQQQRRRQGWWENLPEDVIFIKLPVSSILSARAVCKSWKARLDSSEFRKLYDLNCTRENQGLVVGNITTEGTVISIYNNARWYHLPFTWRWEVCGGVGGLLLLKKSENLFMVGNPISNNWKELPPLPVAGYANCMGMVQGADAKSYKVVIVSDSEDLGKAPIVYDSEVGHWSVKKSRDMVITTFSPPMLCNGVIYGDLHRSKCISKYNVETDELTYVDVAKTPHEGGLSWLSWIVPWKGNIYMFEQPMAHSHALKPLGVWVLHKDEWVLLSRSRWKVSDSMLWLDGDIVKIFGEGRSAMITYNLVADSWSLRETEGPPPPLTNLLLPGVCIPLSFTAAP